MLLCTLLWALPSRTPWTPDIWSTTHDGSSESCVFGLCGRLVPNCSYVVACRIFFSTVEPTLLAGIGLLFGQVRSKPGSDTNSQLVLPSGVFGWRKTSGIFGLAVQSQNGMAKSLWPVRCRMMRS